MSSLEGEGLVREESQPVQLRTFRDVRKEFGSFDTRIELARYVPEHNLNPDKGKFVIVASSEARRGPKTGDPNKDRAPLDLVFDAQEAERLYELLGKALEEYKQEKNSPENA